ncbi:MAG: ribokinase, partial [SAR202 cluster bacterium]|nr:ribokinase [SAR202 cluster bacterium]
INIDLTALTSRLPLPGETIIGENFYTTPGGKGANQAVAAARLGSDVSMVGKIGRDIFGPGLVADMRREGVDVQNVVEDTDKSSGVAVILLNEERQNHIVQAHGANAECGIEQLSATKRSLNGADALLVQQEIPVSISMEAAQFAQDQGVKVFWDPAPVREVPDNCYKNVYALTPNQTEAFAITGVKVKDRNSAEKASEKIRELGVPVAIVKMGEDGVFYSSEDDIGYIQSFDVTPVDTVAAGDAFAAALAVAVVENLPLRDAVMFGSAAGALAVTKKGAQVSMPTLAEVESLLLDHL